MLWFIAVIEATDQCWEAAFSCINRSSKLSFRAISYLLTGSEDSHSLLRDKVIYHMSSQRQLVLHTSKSQQPTVAQYHPVWYGPMVIWAYLKPILRLFVSNIQLSMSNIWFWSDGPSSQYKQKEISSDYIKWPICDRFLLAVRTILKIIPSKGDLDSIGATVKHTADPVYTRDMTLTLHLNCSRSLVRL